MSRPEFPDWQRAEPLPPGWTFTPFPVGLTVEQGAEIIARLGEIVELMRAAAPPAKDD